MENLFFDISSTRLFFSENLQKVVFCKYPAGHSKKLSKSVLQNFNKYFFSIIFALKMLNWVQTTRVKSIVKNFCHQVEEVHLATSYCYPFHFDQYLR